MADSITDHTATESDRVTEAATHLEYVKAVADMVKTLVNLCGTDSLDQLDHSTLESAMHLIVHHADIAATKLEVAP